jgi:hypothetical protein
MIDGQLISSVAFQCLSILAVAVLVRALMARRSLQLRCGISTNLWDEVLGSGGLEMAGAVRAGGSRQYPQANTTFVVLCPPRVFSRVIGEPLLKSKHDFCRDRIDSRYLDYFQASTGRYDALHFYHD